MEILKDMGKDASQCTGECEVEIAKNIGADYVVSGELAQIKELYILTIKLHETRRGNLIGTESVETEELKKLLRMTEDMGQTLFQDLIRSQAQIDPNITMGFSEKGNDSWNAHMSSIDS